MTEEPNSPLNQALAGLGTTINTITDKVESGKQKVKAYKAQIITKLREIAEQLNSLKTNNNLQDLPQLRKQLQDTQIALQQKNQELDNTKSSLNEANLNLQQLQQNIQQINRQIEEKNQQLESLRNEGLAKDNEINDLKSQIIALNKQKEDAEKTLAAAQQQSNSLVEKIGQINANLANQIGLIDTIVSELGNLDSGTDDVAIQFKAIGDNITSIIDMLNNPGQARTEKNEYDVETNFNNLMNLHSQVDKGQYQRYVQRLDGQTQNNIAKIINKANSGDQSAINTMKQILQQNSLKVPNVSINGGKSKSKISTNKYKKNKKNKRKTYKKMKGGYVYSASKELDNSSSVVSDTSSSDSETTHSKSSSKTKSTKLKRKNKTRRKFMK